MPRPFSLLHSLRKRVRGSEKRVGGPRRSPALVSDFSSLATNKKAPACRRFFTTCPFVVSFAADRDLAELEEHVGIVERTGEVRRAEAVGRQRDIAAGVGGLVAGNLTGDQRALVLVAHVRVGG